MPDQLIVLMIADRALRGALIDRLSAHPGGIVTIAGEPDDHIARFAAPAILVIDLASLRARPHWLRDGARCDGMILLADRTRTCDEARVKIIDRRDALIGVPLTLAQWRAEASAGVDQSGGKGDS